MDKKSFVIDCERKVSVKTLNFHKQKKNNLYKKLNGNKIVKV